MEWGTFTIFQWNGKDLFLQAKDGSFVVLSHQELPGQFHEHIVVGRQIEIAIDGEIKIIRTPQEKEQDLDKAQRHVKVRVAIAQIEGMGENTLPPYALAKLKSLRRELEQYEPLDPTAITIEQKNANISAGFSGPKMYLRKP